MSDQAKGPSAVKADKNPNGGLSAKGRKKFGVQKGVTNYSGASRKDKGRWVSWAMRFTGTPKPVKDAKGNPTRYALMFRAWGEKVPTSVEDVRAVHAKAVKRSKELKSSDKAEFSFADMTDDFAESLECSDCDRAFLIYNGLLDHVDTVHLNHVVQLETAEATQTFEDIRRLVSEVVREKYAVSKPPGQGSTYAWIDDLATDWVVFLVEEPNDTTLYKASYSITDGNVTLGDPVEVRRRTVYEPVKKDEN